MSKISFQKALELIQQSEAVIVSSDPNMPVLYVEITEDYDIDLSWENEGGREFNIFIEENEVREIVFWKGQITFSFNHSGDDIKLTLLTVATELS